MDHEGYDNKEAHLLPNDGVTNDETLPSTAEDEKLKISPTSPQHIDKDNLWLLRCRVCQCIDSDSKRDDALRFLVITPPRQDSSGKDVSVTYDTKRNKKNISCTKSESVEFVSPTGEIFVCSDDIEKGPHCHQDALIHLGCSCKGDLSVAHYACALRWFYFRKAKSCEICGSTVENVRTVDLKKIRACLEEFESLKKRTEAGEHSFSQVQTNLGVDPDAVAAIRRQRLTEAATYFNPQSTSEPTLPRAQPQSPNAPSEDDVPAENSRTQWAVESTGILVATGLLTVTLAWLIAPHVGKRTAKSGLHILLGGFCALTVVVFLRFAVLPRIKYGPARYWAILFVFWFLVFGIWASRTHGAHST